MTTPSHTRVALVSGAASGMGRATAVTLAEAGWRVIALDRVSADLEAAGGRLRTRSVDVTDRDQIRAILAMELAPGELQLVANVAGIYPPSTLAESS